MPAPEKHRHRSGYRAEETAQVQAACLTVAATLGAFADRFCIVGGLVPSLLIDLGGETENGAHCGTNDLDVGLGIALLDGREYAEITRLLKVKDFQPDRNEAGNLTPQRWMHKTLNVTIDFLLPPTRATPRSGMVQSLGPTFGALVSPGLELAFEEREHVTMSGWTLSGERITRTVPVCGPAAFVVLKALAFGDRTLPKDAYDLHYVLSRWPGGVERIASRLRRHAERHAEIVGRALELLARDFADDDHVGPQHLASFNELAGEERDAATADAYGYVDDLLRACRRLKLGVSG